MKRFTETNAAAMPPHRSVKPRNDVTENGIRYPNRHSRITHTCSHGPCGRSWRIPYSSRVSQQDHMCDTQICPAAFKQLQCKQ